eukprot:6490815-Amphidinium_carterae.5
MAVLQSNFHWSKTFLNKCVKGEALSEFGPNTKAGQIHRPIYGTQKPRAAFRIPSSSASSGTKREVDGTTMPPPSIAPLQGMSSDVKVELGSDFDSNC